MITMEEAERIDGEFSEAFEMKTVSRRHAAEKMYAAWQELYALMGREKNYSNYSRLADRKLGQ